MSIFHTIAEHPLAGFSVIGLIIAFFSAKVRQYIILSLSRAVFIFVRRTYLHKSLGDAFITYLLKNGYKVKRFSGELLGEDPAFIRSENEVKHVLYRDVNSNTQIFYPEKGILKDWPIFLSGTPLIQSKDTVKNYAYIIYTPRWSRKYISLLDAATDLKNNKEDEEDLNQFVVKRVSGAGGKAQFQIEKNRNSDDGLSRSGGTVSEAELADPFSTFIPVRWDKDNIGQLVYHNSLEMMSLNQELEDVLEEIKFWLENQEWYEERGIPWKRGFLFWGLPGTGKTMFTRALAEKLNLPLIIFDLASMDSTEFNHAWSQLLPRRIALFEDFDAIFDKRHNIQDSGLDFSTVLNCLDGADKKNGILTIITTNHPEKLDFALGGPNENNEFNGDKMPSRPGRIDRSVRFIPLDRPGRLKLARRILKDEKLAEKVVDEGINDSAAQLQERSFRLAIEMLFDKRKPEEGFIADK